MLRTSERKDQNSTGTRVHWPFARFPSHAAMVALEVNHVVFAQGVVVIGSQLLPGYLQSAALFSTHGV